MIDHKLAVDGLAPQRPARRATAPAFQSAVPPAGNFAPLMEAGPAQRLSANDDARDAAEEARTDETEEDNHAIQSGSMLPSDFRLFLQLQGPRSAGEDTADFQSGTAGSQHAHRSVQNDAIRIPEKPTPGSDQVTAGTTHSSPFLVDSTGQSKKINSTNDIEFQSLQSDACSPHQEPESRINEPDLSDGKSSKDGRGEGRAHAGEERTTEAAKISGMPPGFERPPPASPARQILTALAAPVAELMAMPQPPGAAGCAQQLQIVLHPGHLGAINVILRLDGKRLSVTIEAEERETAGVLRRDKTVLVALLHGVAQGAAAVTVTVRDAGLTGRGQQPDDWSGGFSGNAGTSGQDRESGSIPDKARGARTGRQEEPIHDKSTPSGRLRRGIVVI